MTSPEKEETAKIRITTENFDFCGPKVFDELLKRCQGANDEWVDIPAPQIDLNLSTSSNYAAIDEATVEKKVNALKERVLDTTENVAECVCIAAVFMHFNQDNSEDVEFIQNIMIDIQNDFKVISSMIRTISSVKNLDSLTNRLNKVNID